MVTRGLLEPIAAALAFAPQIDDRAYARFGKSANVMGRRLGGSPGVI